jgi:DMSO reductase family type II enzyme molybdopterin subunit
MPETNPASPSLRRLRPLEPGASVDELLSRDTQYLSWKDVYRDKWSWDKVAKVTHHRVNCNNACSFDAYVKDGVVLREEQNANYEQAFPDVPDFNPRGCVSGCAYSVQMYDPTRIKFPMKQIGGRGSGKWQRLSWDQAMTEIADKLLDVVRDDGPECIMYEVGPATDFGIGSPMEGHLFANGLGGTTIDVQSAVGDLPTGLIQTYGLYMMEGTSDDWFLSDYVLIWISNPAYTRQADIHFTNEARYRGAKVVSISPDYNASTVHADLWMNVRFGTDAALAMAMVSTILEEGLYKADYVKEQTDLPFLVRADTGRFLRQSDIIEGGKGDVFYFWNTLTGRKEEVPGTWGSKIQSLALDEDTDPALEGAHRVRLHDGRRVTVRPVFELVRQRAAMYAPELSSEITGVHASTVRQVAREFAAAKSAMIHSSWGACKHYHSDLFQRGMAYLCALTGNSGGKPGSGIKVGALWAPPFLALMQGPMGSPGSVRLNTEPTPEMPIDRLGMQEFAKMTYAGAGKGPITTLIPWLYTHDAKFRETSSRQEYNDPALTRPVADYMREIIEKGWQPVVPAPGKTPRFYWISGTNPLRRLPNPKGIREGLWANLDTVVTSDVKMNTTALWSDYVLPACGWYEKPGIKYTMSYIPYVVVGDRAVEPLYESKHEWDMVLMLARKLQERARARGVEAYTDPFGRRHDPANMYDDITADGAYTEGEEGEKKALNFIFQHSAITKANELGEDAWEKVVEAGMVKIEAMKPISNLTGIYSDYTTEHPINSCGWFVERKNPWPTLTGRQQFYIDHEWFLEIGEEMVVHKEPLPAGGDYPLRLSGGHNRWSMHSGMRVNAMLLSAQRGEPSAFLSEADARSRGIVDGDLIRVFNDVGEFEIHAQVSPSAGPGVVIVYHAWEGFQFRNWATQNDVDANPPKPTNMVGNYGQLHHRQGSYTMNHIPKEVAVEIVKIG